MTGYVWVLVVFGLLPTGERAVVVSGDIGGYEACKELEADSRQRFATEIALGKMVVEGCVLQQQE